MTPSATIAPERARESVSAPERPARDGPSRPRRVVVLGGGFAGISTAGELAKLVASRQRRAVAGSAEASEIGVTLVNRDNYFVFQPLLTDILPGTIETTNVVVPLRRMLRGVDVDVGRVVEIDHDRRVVRVRRSFGGGPVEIAYDALVIALGSVTDFAQVPGMAEYAVGLRTLGDAFYLRNRALELLEEARLEPDLQRRAHLLTFVVVGGGSTGVEVAAELNALLDAACSTFPDLGAVPRVILVHSGPYVVPSLGERLGRYATRKLAEVGVELALRRRLTAVDEDRVRLDDGSTIAASTVVSTVGNAPHPVVSTLPAPKDARGWILPEPTFAVPGLDGMWAVGDCASIIDPKMGQPMPATAQHAVREGPACARNVLAWLDGRPQEPFHYREQGMLVSLGRGRGVGQVLGLKVSGFIAWALWRSYYLLRLPSLERRIRVWLDWTLDLFLPPDVVEIRVRRTRTRPTPEGEDIEVLGG